MINQGVLFVAARIERRKDMGKVHLELLEIIQDIKDTGQRAGCSGNLTTVCQELIEISTAKKLLESKEKELKNRVLAEVEPGFVFNGDDHTVKVLERESLVVDDRLIKDLKDARVFSKVTEEKVSVSKVRGIAKSNQKVADALRTTSSEYVEVR